MTEGPILFSGPMVRAILAGRKTQTRRLKFNGQVGDVLWVRETWATAEEYDSMSPSVIASNSAEIAKLPPLYYFADHAKVPPLGVRRAYIINLGKKRVSIFMPRAFSRLDLLVTAVRTEPLHAISPADARREGFNSIREFFETWEALHPGGNPDVIPAVVSFRMLDS